MTATPERTRLLHDELLPDAGRHEVPLCVIEGTEAALTEVTDDLAGLLDRSVRQLEGLRLLELVHADDLVEVVAGLDALAEGDPEVLLDCSFLAADGGPVHVQWVARQHGAEQRWAVCARDRSQVERLHTERAELRRRVALALGPPAAAAFELDVRSGCLVWEQGAAGVLATGVGRLPDSAAALAALVRREDADVLRRAVVELVSAGSTEVVVRALRGTEQRWLCLRGQVVERDRHKRARRALGVVLDVTRERAVEAQMVSLSSSGTLPGVPHRRAFDTALASEWRRSSRSLEPISVLLLDLDDFAEINREHGHETGDEVLVRVARALGHALHRAGDVLARTGGQEFGVVLPGIDEAGALIVAERLVQRVRGLPLAETDRGLVGGVTISVGVATWAAGSADGGPDHLVAQARSALATAKGAGKDCARAGAPAPDEAAHGLG